MAELELAELRRLSRALSCVEDRAEGYLDLLRGAYGSAELPAVIGVTGPPGAGKSTLVDALAAYWGVDGSRIAILAADPSSPFSGGAILGDRIRMELSQAMRNVYFRSLSARGQVGGLSAATCDLIALLGGFGFSRVILETVGAGQSDVEINSLADCTIVVAVPGLGDGVQAQKAGIMEIADLYAVNKCDLPGADSTRAQIEATLDVAYSGPPGVGTSVGHSHGTMTSGLRALAARHGDPASEPTRWRPPVLPVSARKNEGLTELGEGVEAFLRWSEETGRLARRRRRRIADQVERCLIRKLLQPYLHEVDEDAPAAPPAFWVDKILRGETTPQDAACMMTTQPRTSAREG